MAFTIDDFQDLLRLLEEHPEWRAELRRQVLTEELLELPALVRQLAEHLAALTSRVDALAEAQARTELQLGALTDRVDALVAQVALLADRVGEHAGELLEVRYARRGPAYFSRLARRLRLLETGPLADLLDDAVRDGQLAEAEREDILQADLVFQGRRREDDEEVYLLVEVSVGIGLHDVERASERAQMLAKLGRPVVAVVAGGRIDPETEAMARAHGVWWVLDGRAIPPSAA